MAHAASGPVTAGTPVHARASLRVDWGPRLWCHPNLRYLLLVASAVVETLVDGFELRIGDMSINLRGGDVGVPE